MRVALYARVSTKQEQNPETQLIQLRDFAKARHLDIAGEYVDIGWSGAKEKRPNLDRLMRDARLKKFEAVLVWRFDRFARSTTHLLSALDEFRKLQTDFISFSEAIDTTTPIGKMVFTILGAVAEMERELIRERVLAGMDRAQREGKKLGRPTVLVDRIKIQERLKNESVSRIARDIGIARSTVRAIRNSMGKHDGGGKAQDRGGENPLPS